MSLLPLLILSVLSYICLSITVALAISLSKPGCPEKCGNVTIPYPFGIGPECSATPNFTIICQNSKPFFLSSTKIEVVDISLFGSLIVKLPVSPMNCSVLQRTMSLPISLSNTVFTFSAYYNSLVVLGCKNSVWLHSDSLITNQTLGCMAICDANSTDTSCSGINCCQTTLQPRSGQFEYTYRSIEARNNSFCGYVFPVDKKWLQNAYSLYSGLLQDLSNPYDPGLRFVPLVIDWEYVEGQYLHDNTVCKWVNSVHGKDYDIYYSPHFDPTGNNYYSSITYCYCRDGLEGNPALGRDGCVDIDECSNKTLNICAGNGTCINKIGGFTCRKRPILKIVSISVGSGIGALILLLGAWFSTRAMRKRIKEKHKRKCLALLLEQQLSSIDNGLDKTRLFSSKELAVATDHYNENRIIGRGGQGTVYKGMLATGRIVAVKKSKKVEESDLLVFINEVLILSQINHRNVVKLLGCCVETEVPLLVFEFVSNGTLHQHIHDPSEEFPLSWELRARIAREIAGALSYLHSAASAPIYHRDIKSTNILLDEKYRAKVSDFGTSKSVDADQTHLTTRVMGTFGYLDPEYFQSSQFTEKSDVYSFGVVMVELLTGEKAVSAITAEEGRGLAAHFLHSMEQNQLFDILDARVIKEGEREEIIGMAELARRCLHMNGKRRPTMKEVAVELEGINMVKEGTCEDVNGECNGVVEDEELDDFSSLSGSIHDDDTITQFSVADADLPLLDKP